MVDYPTSQITCSKNLDDSFREDNALGNLIIPISLICLLLIEYIIHVYNRKLCILLYWSNMKTSLEGNLPLILTWYHENPNPSLTPPCAAGLRLFQPPHLPFPNLPSMAIEYSLPKDFATKDPPAKDSPAKDMALPLVSDPNASSSSSKSSFHSALVLSNIKNL